MQGAVVTLAAKSDIVLIQLRYGWNLGVKVTLHCLCAPVDNADRGLRKYIDFVEA